MDQNAKAAADNQEASGNANLCAIMESAAERGRGVVNEADMITHAVAGTP